MKTILILFSFLIAYTGVSYSQTYSCGTIADENQKNFELSQTPVYNEITKINKKLAITVHVVLNENGLWGIDTASIENAFIALNNVFDRIGLDFYIREFKEVENYNLNVVRYGSSSENDLVVQNYEQNTINIYFANNIFNNVNSLICSYTYMPAYNKDVIFFSKDCFHQSVLIEQIGHLLGLYHTHETVFGTSLANGSNCSTTGDLCCDTPAEFNLNTFVGSDCSYLGKQTDASGDPYMPSVHNYMSASRSECKCRLTDEQYVRVLNVLIGVKGYLR